MASKDEILFNPEIHQITVFGDWHGNRKWAVGQLNHCRNDGSDIFFHVGDFGVWGWPEDDFVHAVNEELVQQGKELWFIDGNHENFHILENLQSDDRGLGKVASNIFHVPRGMKWRWGKTDIIALGGAVSIDREFRKVGVSWFPQEQITRDDLEKALSQGHADIIFTHDAPEITWESRTYGWPQYLLDESAITRRYIAELIRSSGARMCVHGHHHRRYEGSYGMCKVVGLDCDGGDFNLNALIIEV